MQSVFGSIEYLLNKSNFFFDANKSIKQSHIFLTITIISQLFFVEIVRTIKINYLISV